MPAADISRTGSDRLVFSTYELHSRPKPPSWCRGLRRPIRHRNILFFFGDGKFGIGVFPVADPGPASPIPVSRADRALLGGDMRWRHRTVDPAVLLDDLVVCP